MFAFELGQINCILLLLMNNQSEQTKSHDCFVINYCLSLANANHLNQIITAHMFIQFGQFSSHKDLAVFV